MAATANLVIWVLLAQTTAPASGSSATSGSTTAILSASVPAALSVGGLRFDAVLRAESRAGEMPVLPGLPPQAFVAAVVTPRLDVELRSPRTDWTLWYSPRLLWQSPHPPSSSDLPVLHTVGSALNTRMSRTTELSGTVTGSVGEPDYTSLQQVLGTVQATLPPVLEIATANAQARLAVQLSRRWALGIAGGGSYWRWLKVPDGLADSTVTSALSVLGGPFVSFRAAELDTFRLELPISAAWYSTDTEIFAITPTGAWRRALARTVDLTVRLGMTYAQQRLPATVLAPASSEATESPVGSVEIASTLSRWNDVVFAARGAAGVDYYLDPILAVGLRRWFASAALDAISVPNWALDLRGDFATVFGEVPVAAGAAQPDETVFSVSLTVHRRLSPYLFTEFGGLWADRGPALQTTDFRFHQRQLWAFVTLGANTAPVSRPTSGLRY